MNRTFLIIVGLFFSQQLFPGVPVGAWRDHLSYRRATHVAVTPEKVFAAAGEGIIIYNKSDNSIEKLSKVNGLSDVDIRIIKWSDHNQCLLIGYGNGNIDLISGGRIFNVSDIMISSVAGSKIINNIFFVNNLAYLATDFGVVVIDIERRETKETYFLGEGGQRLIVNDITFDGTYLYAATSAGLYRAEIAAPNLLDFSYWQALLFLPEPYSAFTSVTSFGNAIYAVQTNSQGNNVLIEIEGQTWSYFPAESPVLLIVKSNENRSLTIINQLGAVIYDNNLQVIANVNGYSFSGMAIRDIKEESNGTLWVADRVHGLIRINNGVYDIVTPPGPFTNNVYSITSYPNRTYFAAGGITISYGNLWNNGEFSLFSNEQWSTRINYSVRDLLRVIEHPGNPDLIYAATWGYGILEYRSGSFFQRFAESNSSLTSIIPGGDFVRIGGMTFDSENNLWITNSGVNEPVSVYKSSGEWLSFPYGGIVNHSQIGEIIINRYGQKWTILPRGGGLFVFDNGNSLDDFDDDQTRKLNVVDETGTLISNEIYSIAEDMNGFIWVGTNTGVVVYYNPQQVFAGGMFPARRIVVEGSRGDDVGYLLNNEIVTAIAVDGGDRKWFGTEKSGIFLVSPDGRTQLHHFTVANSPLLSNTITDIEIEPSSGEVFFSTKRGVVSFRGEATSSDPAFEKVYVFPNPVREDYSGPITITGLSNNAIVKITDITGNLVFQTNSIGGQAIWDGRNVRGNRVATGVYLVFISSPDGSETHVTKLMFIR